MAGELAPHTQGGLGVAVDALLSCLHQHGMAVTALAVRPPRAHGPWGHPYRVEELPPGRRVYGNPVSPKARGLIRQQVETHDVVHAHSHLFFPSLLAFAAARRAGRPFVVTSHGLSSQTAPAWLSALWLRTAGAFLFRRADAVVCLKSGDHERLLRLGVPATRLHLIPNMVDTNVFRPGAGGRTT
ncbi:MAG TPA: glycosyltransferase, partial [Candidatus Thermoplasmatota archaeon]|nr:glycosyltransferase [Candidatus Thermoplasmatota archaeon]